MAALRKQLIQRVSRQACTSRLLFAQQLRLKTYLIGVDGSNYGYAALRKGAMLTTEQDKLVSIYFPPNIALYTQGATVDDTDKKQQAANQKILDECKKVVQLYGHEHVHYTAKLGETTFSPKDDLVQACYDEHADMLILGSKGIAHTLREKLSEKLNRIGGVADYCMHHSPCDVLVVKQEHDNILYDEKQQ
mmetsp:Transcript_37439/g.59962  ORF Transcript_37439/g.59962 Transcript_37439/m.59962 type:complete len:191 (-) Transcript_37439:24-596(-)|eukprot:CAMPEP_0197023362 /NCGR_PEP_ID=MMETSP1384-20130603/4067_1 /TAXON_ID=29189 /ORGANISM="Ammonia sp." /LENGTH=190 /DNA_ID=CAMNT_0042451559 /DNA_START=38 /DNA_END=610 /DNA_ORIENTATION=-